MAIIILPLFFLDNGFVLVIDWSILKGELYSSIWKSLFLILGANASLEKTIITPFLNNGLVQFQTLEESISRI